MDAEYMERLKVAGVDTESAIRRFSGNSAMFEKFLRKFPTDDSFAQIEPPLESRDY